MKQIFKRLPQNRQIVLFSATQTPEVEKFAKLSFEKNEESKKSLFMLELMMISQRLLLKACNRVIVSFLAIKGSWFCMLS
ncbi:hypothetical protein ZEAMMB73_Zm00001d010628 [Zea mays]|uniref:Uncharacterized protein n=2 Tax=Zea mays TaxID=4577 RepID=A0A1D6FSG4_MAIZE|nr:hypothetical protein ZEAMMB73_Zm00001d010628 [Zea mays]